VRRRFLHAEIAPFSDAENVARPTVGHRFLRQKSAHFLRQDMLWLTDRERAARCDMKKAQTFVGSAPFHATVAETG
jgi:hypothetical protein